MSDSARSAGCGTTMSSPRTGPGAGPWRAARSAAAGAARTARSSTDSAPVSERSEPHVSAASSAARPRREHRSGVGRAVTPTGRPPGQDPRTGRCGGEARGREARRKSIRPVEPYSAPLPDRWPASTRWAHRKPDRAAGEQPVTPVTVCAIKPALNGLRPRATCRHVNYPQLSQPR
ncbi:MAG: hypothetical protein RL014_1856 [Pseudomonadota bacterium]